jgi:DUF4097 and DUF4098 domain-containing protein YvlB
MNHGKESVMFRRTVPILALVCATLLLTAAAHAESGKREFPAAAGGTLVLELDAGGSVWITGTGGSSVIVDYLLDCSPPCEIGFDETGDGLEISTEFTKRGSGQRSEIELRIQVPSYFDVNLDSMGGRLSIDGVEGEFRGKTMGGRLTLHDVRGEAKLTTMGGRITLTDSELDGSLKTMGGEVLFENVIGDVKGSSMGGNVRYKNVQRRDGELGSPPRTGGHDHHVGPDTVQISTMGGAIEIEDAPEGADLHTMGGNIEIRDAQRFVRAKTMGGDILIDAVDGWVEATTMGGDIEVTVTGSGGNVTLVSMSGDVELEVPSGFGMDLDLEIAFTRNSRQEYRIEAPGGMPTSVTPEWDRKNGTPRKYIRMTGAVDGGGNTVKITTVNGNITVK